MDVLDRIMQEALPWLLGLTTLATAAALLFALRHYLNMRRASFFILRQRFRRKLRNALALAALFAALTVAIYYVLRSWPMPAEEASVADLTSAPSLTPVQAVNSASIPPASHRTLTSTAEPVQHGPPTVPFIPSHTPTSTSSHTPTPSMTPSRTPTPSITPTPSPTVPVLEAIYTPVTPFAPVPAAAQIGELAVSRGVEVNGTPINAGTEFPEGQAALYVSFDYEGMENGVLWRHIWLRDDLLFGGGTRVWEWGSSGRTYFFLRPNEGFPPGEYEVGLLLGEGVVRRVFFTVPER